MRKTFAISVLAGLAIASAGPSAATADTVVIGSALTQPSAPGFCGFSGCTGIQVGQVGGLSPFPLTSPVNGVITSWKVRSADEYTLFTLRTLRQSGVGPTGPRYTALASSPAPTSVPVGAVDTVFDYPAALPIAQGDSIGVLVSDVPPGVTEGLPQVNTTLNPDVMGYVINLADGASQDSFSAGMHELNLQATIKTCKVPTLTGLTEAAATAALTQADCTATVTKKPLKLKKGKSKKAKKKNRAIRAQVGKVLSQGSAPGATLGVGAAVTIEVGELAKKKKKKRKKN